MLDRDAQKEFSFRHHPGQENLGDYPSKAHTGTIHQHVRPYYVHAKSSPRFLQRASMPSACRGCAETLDDPYYSRVALLKIPSYHMLDRQARAADVTNDEANTTWHSRLLQDTRLLDRLPGPTNYYARLRNLHNPYR